MSKVKNTANTGKKSFFQNLATQRRFRFGGFALLVTAIVLAVAILLNVVLGMVEDNWALSIDLSPTRVTNFDDATKETLKEVDKDIVIYLLYQDATNTELRVQLEEMGQKYHALNSHISVDTINPYTEPAKLAKYVDTTTSGNLPEGSLIVARADDTKSRSITRSDLYRTTYYEDSSSQYGFSYGQAFNGEAMITSAIKYVNSDNTPNVYLLDGHNELGAGNLSTFTNYLKRENYNVEQLVLGGETVPQANDVIVVTCPQVDMTDDEYAVMSQWLQNGGRLLMSMDNQTNMDDLPNFKALLEIYQLSFGDGYVVEDASMADRWISQQVMVIPTVNAENEITSNLASNNLRLVVYGGRPINETGMPLSGVLYDTLLSSSEKSYVKPSTSSTELNDTSDATAVGSQILAYTAIRQPDYQDPTQDTRIVLLSTPFLYADTSILTSSYDLDFSLSCVEWLVNRDVSVYVRASEIITTTLEVPDAATVATIGIVSIGVIPLVVAAVGIVVWVRRRRL